MNFDFSEEQRMLRDLAREILEREVTPERLRAAEASPDAFDAALWSTLAEANLLGVAVPEAQGGTGFGLAELCLLLHEVGRAVAPVPALPALLWAGLPVAERGTPEQHERWLGGLAGGSLRITAGLLDAGSDDPARPSTKASRDGGAWVLEGGVREVPAVHLAERVLVPAAAEGGVGLFLVDPQARGVRVTRGAQSGGEPLFALSLGGVRVAEAELLGGEAGIDPEAGTWLLARALVGVCAVHLGVAERALEITADYVRGREQFGVPIGSFQAVQHRLADGWIDLQCMRWTTWRAIDRLVRGEPAAREAAVAKWWTAEGGARIAAAAQHLHGGMGSDVDYPIHRYFVWSRRCELMLGGAAPWLARLGRDLARTGPEETA